MTCEDCAMYSPTWGCFWVYHDKKGIMRIGSEELQIPKPEIHHISIFTQKVQGEEV